MSIKSLLQIILFLLIILILGGIYYLYFYSETLNDQINLNEKENALSQITISQNNFDKDIMEEIDEKDLKDKLIEDNKITDKILEENKNEYKDVTNNNLTKEIEYITTNKNGDIFKIIAKFGSTNKNDNKILDLEEVIGTISSNKKSTINISSKFAKYNYTNQNSKFYNNVKIDYDGKTINCDNLEIMINENTALAYDNVIVKSENSLIKAQTISLDLITKDIKINSKNKIKIRHEEN